MKREILSALCALGLCSAAWGIDEGPSSEPQKQTEAWLQLQVRGHAASPVPQTMTPSERDQSLQRWLNNNHPIPEFYEQKKEGSVSSGGK
ncbi:DUF3613 domain-containing protein [Pseudomonas sp. NPDC089734]|uniref:DUF3613 domain-containing protein n=1 Tax=Pseudomonas sp. NPDC089734 TaxID=3364469 RepID=UPI0038016988